MRMIAVWIAACAVLGGCATGSDWLNGVGRATGTGLTEDQIVAGLKQDYDLQVPLS